MTFEVATFGGDLTGTTHSLIRMHTHPKSVVQLPPNSPRGGDLDVVSYGGTSSEISHDPRDLLQNVLANSRMSLQPMILGVLYQLFHSTPKLYAGGFAGRGKASARLVPQLTNLRLFLLPSTSMGAHPRFPLLFRSSIVQQEC